MKRIVVIGGGISGLAAAHRLWEIRRERSLPLQITVLEASPRLGGLIETEQRQEFLLEGGPDAFLSEKPWAVELCRRLGMENELIPTNEGARRGFIAWKGKMELLPEGFYLTAPVGWAALRNCRLLDWAGKLRVACEPVIPKRSGGGDESVASFIRRRLGAQVLERIAQPMVGGIYAADLEKLSVQAALPQFYRMEQEQGSILCALKKGGVAGSEKASGPRYGMFVAPRSGMTRLVEVLTRRMLEVELKTNHAVAGMERSGRNWTVCSKQGAAFQADGVCVALPAHHAAALLNKTAPTLARELEGIPYESVATVSMAFRKKDFPVPFEGFGFVVPAHQAQGIVGCTFSSMKFARRAPADSVLLRAFVGGALAPRAAEQDDATLQHTVRALLKSMLEIQAEPRFAVVRRYPKSMPQYPVGHGERVERIERETARLPALALAGNAYHGIGIPDCIHQAEQAAERISGAV